MLGTGGRRILKGLVKDCPQEEILAGLTPEMVAKRTLLEQTLGVGLDPRSRWLLRDLLSTIPGIDRASARTILAELGPDPAAFGNTARLAAWAGLCPGNNESSG